MTINCPRCQTKTLFTSDNPHRPFCSKLCKDEDIAAWASGENVISTPITEKDSLSDADIEAITQAIFPDES